MERTEEKTMIQKLKEQYPEMPGHFEAVVKETLGKELSGGTETASPVRGRGKRKRFIPVLAAAVVLGTSAAALAETDTISNLRKLFKLQTDEKLDQQLQEKLQENVTAEVENGDFSGPLWEISEVWYDGAYLVFQAAATKEGEKYDLGSDHIYINGQDCLMNQDTSEDGMTHCDVDLTAHGFTEALEVEIPLKAWKNTLTAYKKIGTQTIRFTVEKEDTEGAFDAQEIKLEDGYVEVRKAKTALSVTTLDFTYHFTGERARENAKKNVRNFRISDDQGNMADTRKGGARNQEMSAYEGENGEWCRDIQMQVTGLAYGTKSLTIAPYTLEYDEEDKAIPGTETGFSGGEFTIQRETGEDEKFKKHA